MCLWEECWKNTFWGIKQAESSLKEFVNNWNGILVVRYVKSGAMVVSQLWWNEKLRYLFSAVRKLLKFWWHSPDNSDSETDDRCVSTPRLHKFAQSEKSTNFRLDEETITLLVCQLLFVSYSFVKFQVNFRPLLCRCHLPNIS